MKRVLFLDREYATLFVKSDKFESIYACLGRDNKRNLSQRGLTIVGCFDEMFDSLPVADIPNNYLRYSFSSDRFLKGRFNYEKRREILGKEISFWTKILDEQKPDLIVNEVCTTEWVEVLFIEANKRGIEYKSFLYGFRDNYAYWLDSPFNSEISETRWNRLDITEAVKEEAEKFCEALIEKNYRPYYVQNLNNNAVRSLFAGLHGYIKVYLNELKHIGSFHYEDYRNIWNLWMKARLARFFRRYDRIEDIQKKEYVFFPLHFVPEATISYFSEFYSNQAAFIEGVAKSLKSNQVLVVKEHPQQLGMLLTREYQTVKKECANVVYLPGNIPSSDVTVGCKLIVTITGTAGFEGMILGKPVITFGDVFYNHCPECNKLSSYKELKQMIRNDSYVIPDKDRVRKFVAEFFAIQEPGRPTYETTQENLNDLTFRIEQFLSNE